MNVFPPIFYMQKYKKWDWGQIGGFVVYKYLSEMFLQGFNEVGNRTHWVIWVT